MPDEKMTMATTEATDANRRHWTRRRKTARARRRRPPATSSANNSTRGCAGVSAALLAAILSLLITGCCPGDSGGASDQQQQQQAQQQHRTNSRHHRSVVASTRKRRKRLFRNALLVGDDGDLMEQYAYYYMSSSQRSTLNKNDNKNKGADGGSDTTADEEKRSGGGREEGRWKRPPHDPPPLDRSSSLFRALPPFPDRRRRSNLRLVRDMFTHAYDSYVYSAFPASDLSPVSCQPREFDLVKLRGLTLVDSLDTLLLMDNATEFARAVERVRALHRESPLFAVDVNVSLFETNIRVLGGLLSAHQLAVARIASSHGDVVGNGNNKDTNGAAASSKLLRVYRDDVFQDPEGSVVRFGYEAGTSAMERHRDRQRQQARQQQQQQRHASAETVDTSTKNEADDQQEYVPKDERGEEGGDSTMSAPQVPRMLCPNPEMGTSGQQQMPQQGRQLDQRGHQQRWQLDQRGHQQQQQPPQIPDLDFCLRQSQYPFVADDHLQGCQQQQQKLHQKHYNRTEEALKRLPKLWTYDGFLLDLAMDLGNRFLPAFETKTGIPYGTVNLLYGVPEGETTVASLAGGGTLTLEMQLLSRLSGVDKYGKVAMLASRAMFLRKSALQLYGKHIDVRGGQWTETLSGIGSNSDSYHEYLAKHYTVFPRDADFWYMLQASHSGVHNHSRMGEWYVDVDMNQGVHQGHSRRVLESLMAFWPGLQVLLGELAPASHVLNSMLLVREWLGFLPERFHFVQWRVDAGRGAGKHPLRPELLESCYFMHRASKDVISAHRSMGSNAERGENAAPASEPKSAASQHSSSGWLWAADFALRKLENVSRTECGYAGLNDLSPETTGSVNGSKAEHYHLMDEMPSFFLSETLKYLYLVFDEDNFLHHDDDREWVFTTEAHPIHYTPRHIGTPPRVGRFAKEIKSLKELLVDRINRRENGSQDSQPHKSTRPSHKLSDLRKHLWADRTATLAYANQLEAVRTDSRAQRSALRATGDVFFDDRRVLSPFVPDAFIVKDFENDTRQEENIAHLAMGNLGIGPGTLLKRTCPNVYSSDLLWVHALNGGALDYSDVYVSVIHDNVEQHPNQFVVLGAAEALGLLGTGVYLGLSDDEDRSCPIAEGIDNDDVVNQNEVDVGGEKLKAQTRPQDRQGEVFQVRSDVGQFEISPFPDGDGFYMQHLDSGETVVATFLLGSILSRSSGSDTAATARNLVMVHSHLPGTPKLSRESPKLAETAPHGKNQQSPWRRMGNRFSSMFGQAQQQSPSSGEAGFNTLVLGDFEGNSYFCQVEVVESFTDGDSEDSNDNDSTNEVVMARYPCAPAMFGPTQLSLMVKSGGSGIDIEGEGVAPPGFDDIACHPQRTQEDNDVYPEALFESKNEGLKDFFESLQPKKIQVVRRGECSFMSKSINMARRRKADAVIIINDSEDELFIMSFDESHEAEVLFDPNSVPTTVLISGSDGEDLLDKLIVDEDDDDASVVVRISVTRQLDLADFAATPAQDIDWPVVRGSSDNLQIYSKNGWGVQATKRDPVGGEWHLQLLRHSFDGSSS